MFRIALIYLHSGDMPHIVGNFLIRAIILLQTSLQSKVFTWSYGPIKLHKSQFWVFPDSQLGSPRTKWHLGASPMARHKKYYKGGRWWLPPSSGHGEFCEFVFARGSSMHQKCSNYALINLLFDLCRSMWIIDLFVIHLNPHPRTPALPSTPEMLRAKERTQLCIFPLFSPWTRSWVYQGTWGCVISCGKQLPWSDHHAIRKYPI
jgi:hypothetical protein